MASGRINRNAIPEIDSGMGLGGYTLEEGAHIAWSESGDSIDDPIGYHRTTKANIRPHLYGGPQG